MANVAPGAGITEEDFKKLEPSTSKRQKSKKPNKKKPKIGQYLQKVVFLR